MTEETMPGVPAAAMPETRVARPTVTPDPWTALAALGPSRLALGRAGSALPTRHVLDLALAHARARDAVHDRFDESAVTAAAEALDLPIIRLDSAAPDRATYLRRPDFGRRLSRRSRELLEDRAVLAAAARAIDVTIVVGDGLSATAVRDNAAAVVDHLVPLLRDSGLSIGPLCLAGQARVALGDEIGQMLQARFVVVLIGERPGLSAADSLGAYLTFAPRIGRTDADRNCVSNIRPAGLPPAAAARKIAWLVRRAFALGLTGVALKDDSGAVELPSHASTALGG